ncbi:MAG: hypothetical protein ACOYN4_17160 [Bacteroidales bacterium]
MKTTLKPVTPSQPFAMDLTLTNQEATTSKRLYFLNRMVNDLRLKAK